MKNPALARSAMWDPLAGSNNCGSGKLPSTADLGLNQIIQIGVLRLSGHGAQCTQESYCAHIGLDAEYAARTRYSDFVNWRYRAPISTFRNQHANQHLNFDSAHVHGST